MSLLRDEAYAVVRFSKTPHTEYGHIEIRIYDFLKCYNHAVLLIRCQTGGTIQNESYGWKYGLESFSSVLGTDELGEGFKINRAIDRGLAKLHDKSGAPEGFADWALRILTIVKIKQIFVIEQLGGSVPEKVHDLPVKTLKTDQEYMLKTLNTMEAKLLGKELALS